MGLLGTRFTMEQDFYRSRLESTHGLTVLTPPQADRDLVHQIIYEELCLGEVKDSSRQAYLRVIADLQAQGAQAIILGCTEIAMLVQPAALPPCPCSTPPPCMRAARHCGHCPERMPVTTARHETLGMWLGVLGVAIFAVTLPMTRLATGTAQAPQLSPWFVTSGRAALAGALSLVFLLVTRSALPTPAQRKSLGMALLGNAIGYPLLLGFALRQVTSGHAAVITALLPLTTAAIAALVLHQRARLGFWLFASLGSALVVVFSLLRAHSLGHGFGFEWADCAAGGRGAGGVHWAMCTARRSPTRWAPSA